MQLLWSQKESNLNHKWYCTRFSLCTGNYQSDVDLCLLQLRVFTMFPFSKATLRAANDGLRLFAATCACLLAFAFSGQMFGPGQ